MIVFVRSGKVSLWVMLPKIISKCHIMLGRFWDCVLGWLRFWMQPSPRRGILFLVIMEGLAYSFQGGKKICIILSRGRLFIWASLSTMCLIMSEASIKNNLLKSRSIFLSSSLAPMLHSKIFTWNKKVTIVSPSRFDIPRRRKISRRQSIAVRRICLTRDRQRSHC